MALKLTRPAGQPASQTADGGLTQVNVFHDYRDEPLDARHRRRQGRDRQVA